MKNRFLSFFAAAALFALLLCYSAPARAGAENGLRLWGQLLVPSLLPYFTAAGLLTRLGLVAAAGRLLAPVGRRLFGVSGAGCGVFLLGLSGGYPLGAASAAEGVRQGALSRREAEHLLRFCDNTGPAFAVGALGVGVFGSAGWGLLLWVVHALSAAALGIALRGAGETARSDVPAGISLSPAAAALTESISAAVNALLSIGGYVVFFSALLGVTGELGFPGATADALAAATGADASCFRALLAGLLELSSGIGEMAGLAPTPVSLALGSFLLGWGGLCVHLQSVAVTAEAGISLRGRAAGKLLHALLSALVTYLLALCLL